MTTRPALDAESPRVLREYALLADGERGALVGPHGEIAWMCAPAWDSDAVFARLIGGGGSYLVTPVERCVWGGHYEPDTLIWRSRWITETGLIECREALAFPGDPHRAVILRQVRAVAGPAALYLRLQPGAGFGAHAVRDQHHPAPDTWTGRTGPLRWRWSGAPAGTRPGSLGLEANLELAPGQHHDLVLELSDRPLTDTPVDAATAWQATLNTWHASVPPLETSIAPRDARHAYAVLRGLTGHTGGMVAAATMSLPERARQGRNYDYRYAWIRDQCFAGRAAATAGALDLLDDAVRFITARLLEHGPRLAPAYTTTGAPIPDERTLDLPGYPGGADTVGNHVNHQFQLDAFGEALQLLAAAHAVDRLDSDAQAAATVAVDAIKKRWREPDAGIWELEPRRWAHSRLTCAAGLRALANAHRHGPDAAGWHALADAMLADTADSLHPSGRWQRAPDDPRIDAALLLPAIGGALPADDPRNIATLEAVTTQLTDDGYVYRYRPDNRPLGSAEGAFTLCGFLLAHATHRRDPTAAARWFERNRAACGPPGLFAEEYDVTQRQLRGNLPQAFVHAQLLQTSVHLADRQDELHH